jgi:autophagy-related protein 101
VDDADIETLIDQRTSALIHQIDTTSNQRSSSVRGQIAVQFYEKRRRKTWLRAAEEEVCWEQWTVNVTLATPKTESGKLAFSRYPTSVVHTAFSSAASIANRRMRWQSE